MRDFQEHSAKNVPTLAVIGGGLAGIAAAEAAVRRGWNVELFEWSRALGGRTTSQFDPKSRCWIDNGQHVFLGCCAEQIALNQRLGVSDLFDRYETVLFTASENRRWTLSASPFLPPRWQLVPAFLKNPFLSFRDRLATGLLLRKLAKLHRDFSKIDESLLQKPPFFAGADENTASGRPNKPFFSKQETFGHWLRRENASEESIKHFWTPLIYGTLSDTVDGVCLFAAAKVIVQGFMSGREAMTLYVPKCPLREIYNIETQRKLSQLGVKTHLMSRVERLICEPAENPPKIESLVLADGTRRHFDAFILAIPAYRIWKLLEASQLKPLADSLGADRYELGAITAVHLWFDQPILPNSQRQIAIFDGPGQWIFRGEHASSERLQEKGRAYYHQVVISASHRLLSEEELTSKGKQVLIERVLEQLRVVFPETCSEKAAPVLLHAKTTTVYDAVFSPTPEVYRFRPAQNTPVVNLALAGDWTQTNWPATMEGAIRSGLSAVETVSFG